MWTQAPLVLKYLRTPAIYYCHEPPRHMYENNLLTGVKRRRFRSLLKVTERLRPRCPEDYVRQA